MIAPVVFTYCTRRRLAVSVPALATVSAACLHQVYLELLRPRDTSANRFLAALGMTAAVRYFTPAKAESSSPKWFVTLSS